MHFHPPKAQVRSFIWFIIAVSLVGMLLPIWLIIQTIWGAATLAYEVAPSELIIYFGRKTTRIDRSAITAAYVIENPTRGRRHVGTNTLGLKEGSWSFDETGRITLFATTLHPLTVVESDQGKWGISPADPQGLLQALELGRTSHFAPVPGTSQGPLVAILITTIIAGGGFVVLIVYVLGIARNIAYELDADAVSIHGGWRPIRIPYEQITSVKGAEPKGLPWRAYGIGMPGLHWGSFSWKHAGPNLRLYATRLKPLVLISTRLRTYGISPDDTETFISELMRRLPPSDV